MKKLFKDPNLLELALTHRSWLNEHKSVRSSNERLEFLGDAVLEFVISREIYLAFPDKEEGYLTALRASLVNTTALSEVAKKLELGKLIHLSKGEQDTGGRENPSLLADTVEAIIGALFIDQGLENASKFIMEHIANDLEKRALMPLKDPKSSLQEFVQGKSLPTPKYKVISEVGPDHQKRFEIEVEISGKAYGRGEGRSKSEAQQAAAKIALSMIQSRS